MNLERYPADRVNGWLMKKQDRIDRAAKRADQRKQYDEQNDAVAAFCELCRIEMPKSVFAQWHGDAVAHAGNSLHVFEYMLSALSVTRTPITPQLRKSIDHALACHDIERNRVEILSTLQYDDYWKSQYGYS